MTSFVRLFVLVLTPLLGVTGTFGPAALFGLAATLVLLGTAALAYALRLWGTEPLRLTLVAGLAGVLVTLLDLAVSAFLPGVRQAWGFYLPLLALSPWVLMIPLERSEAPSWGLHLGAALSMGLQVTLLLTAAALLREVFGHGTLTWIPGKAVWTLPGAGVWPQEILRTGAGGFFLAALVVVAHRLWKQGHPDIDTVAPAVVPEPPAEAETATEAEAKAEAPANASPAAEPAGTWGETLEDVVASLPASGGTERRRLLVIGSGNGELAYYLAMLGLDQARQHRGFRFVVRGVDHFSTRVETARRGVYREHQLDSMRAAVRDAWMNRGDGDERYFWKVGSEARAAVELEVADFQQGRVFFTQPSHVIVLNQGIEYVTDEKKAQLLQLVYDQVLPGGALIVTPSFRRDLVPEGMKRTGTTVFRKA